VGALPTVPRKQPYTTLRARSATMFEHLAIRAIALGLSALVTLGTVQALARTADHRHEHAWLAHAQSIGAVQQVVITGQRQPRS
jgi:hypothetical protein